LLACGMGVLCGVLISCSEIKLGSQDQKPNPNVYPTNYKTDLLALIQNTHSDNMLDVQEAYVSSPMRKQSSSEGPYFVCLRTESSTGRKYQMAIFFDGQVNQIVDVTAEECGSAAYQPFPELSALSRRLAGRK
jgi:hypothetical protein